jgi:threonyl-tRNA synthetase
MLENNDHRRLARRLDLFHFQEEAPGMAFWHPNGRLLYRLLEGFARDEVSRSGYREVCTPQILRKAIWEKSGHWRHYRDAMFQVQDQGCEAAIKPVSCPGHIQILKHRKLSHRDLPVRMAEFGLVHRDEQSGALHGLMRLRQFTQDDGHIFCRPDQAESEIENFCRSLRPFYAAFGFQELSVAFSTRPDDRAGDSEAWDASEAALSAVLHRLGIPYQVQKGSGAFYGPKLEFILKDRQDREWQCGTIQFDLCMPESFDIHYLDADGVKRPLVILHRALYGSLERFMGILLEHHGPFLPPWLAPVQARVLPVAERHSEGAEEVRRKVMDAGLRCDLDGPEESLGKRVALAKRDAVPFAIVMGDREVAEGSLSIRSGNENESLAREAALARLKEKCAPPGRA